MGPRSDDRSQHSPKNKCNQDNRILRLSGQPVLFHLWKYPSAVSAQEYQTSGSELRKEECGGKEDSQKLKTDQLH